MSQTELAALLTERDFRISVSAINKYESGLRSPPPDFIYHVARALGLTQDEESALIQACIGDYHAKFIAEYLAVAQRYQ